VGPGLGSGGAGAGGSERARSASAGGRCCVVLVGWWGCWGRWWIQNAEVREREDKPDWALCYGGSRALDPCLFCALPSFGRSTKYRGVHPWDMEGNAGVCVNSSGCLGSPASLRLLLDRIAWRRFATSQLPSRAPHENRCLYLAGAYASCLLLCCRSPRLLSAYRFVLPCALPAHALGCLRPEFPVVLFLRIATPHTPVRCAVRN
jgi:hypothetical protein